MLTRACRRSSNADLPISTYSLSGDRALPYPEHLPRKRRIAKPHSLHIVLDLDQKPSRCMTELGAIFEELGLLQYLDIFLEQGFDTWDTILDITESDFDALGVKLGHRRKLQRKIANSRGFSTDRALASPKRGPPTEDGRDKFFEESTAILIRSTIKDGSKKDTPVPTATGKRKYRRHPKADEHAPERPPSAYVIFSNKMREDLKGRHLSFTEIAKLVGENWQNLSPEEKEPFETHALGVKEKYNQAFAEYKKTENYRKHADYLVEFKAKRPNISRDTPEAIPTEPSKRPKLDTRPSAGSSGSASSTTSHSGDIVPGRPRDHSFGSAWYAGAYSPSSKPAAFPTQAMVNHGPSLSQSTATSSVLPGYREAIFGAQQTLAWRDTARDTREAESAHQQQLPRLMNVNERGVSQGTASHERASYPPTLLTSESSSGTMKASLSSTSSSSYYTPRTPVEPALTDRALPIPAHYPQKSISHYELPPIRPPSLSPQSSLGVSYNSPSTIPVTDYPPFNSKHPTPHPPSHPDPIPTPPTDESPMDPVSALLKAGEIVNRKGWLPPPSVSK